MTEYILFIGTYTQKEAHVDGKAEGIYVCSFSTDTGKLTRLHTVTGIVNPSFCRVSGDKKYLYAVSETDTFTCTIDQPVPIPSGSASGGIAAYSIHPETYNLIHINTVPSEGTFPCYVAEDPKGNYLFAANYMSGSAAMFPIERDGAAGRDRNLLKSACSVKQHTGKSINPHRQERPHAHSANIDLHAEYIIVPDLGIDKLMIYQIDRKNGKLIDTDKNISMTPGAGPRHFTFHPAGNYAYAVNELASTITVFSYEKEKCTLTKLQEISALPDTFSGTSTSAEVRIHPNGRFLYASNRGHDSVAVFHIDYDTGILKYIEAESCRGKTPRHFNITPDGGSLLAANQDSDNISIFSLNPDTGLLQFVNSMDVPSPVYISFY